MAGLPPRWRRAVYVDTPTRRRLTALGGVAAAIVLVLVAGALLMDPRYSPLIPSRPAGMLLPTSRDGEGVPVDAGWYYVDVDGYRYTFHVPASGFHSTQGRTLAKGDPSGRQGSNYAALSFVGNPSFVYQDPCHWPGTEKTTGKTASDFVTAGASVEALGSLRLPDLTIDGRPATYIRIGVGDNFDLATCTWREVRSYEGRRHRVRYSVDDLIAIDLENGDRTVVVLSYLSGLKKLTFDSLRYMVDSLRIDPVPPSPQAARAGP